MASILYIPSSRAVCLSPTSLKFSCLDFQEPTSLLLAALGHTPPGKILLQTNRKSALFMGNAHLLTESPALVCIYKQGVGILLQKLPDFRPDSNWENLVAKCCLLQHKLTTLIVECALKGNFNGKFGSYQANRLPSNKQWLGCTY